MEVDLEQKLATARQNAESLRAEEERLHTLRLKWEGVVDYLTSLQEEAKAAAAQAGDPKPELVKNGAKPGK